MTKQKKILAVASQGGHWVQMKRLSPALRGHKVYYLSTDPAYEQELSGEPFFVVTDASRWTKWKLVVSFFQVLAVVVRVRPHIVISTGAAPGLFGVLWGKVFFAKTIWIDSVANSRQISVSGRLAAPFSTVHLTQWPELSDGKRTRYEGSVL